LFHNDKILFLGGYNETDESFQCHALDLLSLSWDQKFSLMETVSGHSAVMLNSHTMLIYGGWNAREYTSDLVHIDLDKIESADAYAPVKADLDLIR
jgi:hypothetical protein